MPRGVEDRAEAVQDELEAEGELVDERHWGRPGLPGDHQSRELGGIQPPDGGGERPVVEFLGDPLTGELYREALHVIGQQELSR